MNATTRLDAKVAEAIDAAGRGRAWSGDGHVVSPPGTDVDSVSDEL